MAERKRAKAKTIWPRMPAPFVQAVLAGHSSLGLAFAALIYLVCFSGTVAVLVHDFERWEAPVVAPVEAAGPETAVATARALLAEHDAVEHIFISLPDINSPRTRIYAELHDGEILEGFAGTDGTWSGSAPTPWSAFMLGLHVDLHLPHAVGSFVVGMTGVALLSLLISGLLSHPRIFRDAFHIRLGGTKRLQEADLHNRAGIWALPFHITIALTGALLGLTTLIAGTLALAFFKGDVEQTYALFFPPALEDDTTPAPVPDLEAILADATARAPGADLRMLRLDHPGETGQSVHVTMGYADKLAFGDSYIYDGNGALFHSEQVSESSLGTRILQTIGPYHFGWFAGWVSKIAYILLGAALTWVTSTGVAIWTARRRSKGHPAPVTERLWTATVWSQPVAYAFSALAALVWPGPDPLLVWAIATGLCLGLTVPLGPVVLSAGLRAASALLMTALPLAHVLRYGADYADPVAWVINAGLLASATLIALSLAWRAAPARQASLA